MAKYTVDQANRAVVGLLGPVAQSLNLGSRPGDTPAHELVEDILQQIRVLQQAYQDVLAERVRVTYHEERPYQLHDQQYRVLNIDDEVVWSGEWKVAGEDGLQHLAAVNHLEELKQRGTDFGMRVERYQRCRWMNLTTQAHDEPAE